MFFVLPQSRFQAAELGWVGDMKQCRPLIGPLTHNILHKSGIFKKPSYKQQLPYLIDFLDADKEK